MIGAAGGAGLSPSRTFNFTSYTVSSCIGMFVSLFSTIIFDQLHVI